MQRLGAPPIDGTESIGRQLRALAFPQMVSSLSQVLLFVVDRAMLGRHSQSALAAMQIAGPLEWSILAVFSAATVATIARVGFHVGAQDRDAQRLVSRRSMALSLAVGVVLALCSPLIVAFVGYTFSGSSEALYGARAYLQITLAGSPLIFLGLFATSILQATGDTKTPLAIAVLTHVVHLGMNRILILGAFGFSGQGIIGAGVSTCASLCLGALVTVLVVLRRGLLTRPAGVSLPPDERQRFRSIAIAATIEKIVYHLGYSSFVWLISKLGDTAMAANQTLISVESIGFLSADAYGIATAAMVAQRLGARDRRGARRVVAAGVLQTGAVLVTFGVLFFVFRRWLLTALSRDAHVVDTAMAASFILCLAQAFMAAGVVMGDALRGAGQSRLVLFVSAFSTVGVRVGATALFTMSFGWGLVGVWLGSTTDWVVRSALLLLLTRHVLAEEP